MAIDTKQTMGGYEFEVPLAASQTFTEEGQIVTSALVNGEEAASVGAASGSLNVIGFSKLDTVSPAATEVVGEEGLTVPSTADSDGDYHVTLEHDAITSAFDANGDVAVYDVTNSTWLGVGAAIADGTFIVSDAANGELEFHSAQAGIEFNVQYRRTLTATQAQQKYQRRHINSGAMDEQQKIGVIAGKGVIYTDQYDVSVGDWSSAVPTTGAGGCITDGGGGTSIAGLVQIIHSPTADEPWLGMRFNI